MQDSKEKDLMEKASKHAGPIVLADPLLRSIVTKALKERQSRAHLSHRAPESFSDTRTEHGRIIVEDYVRRLAGAKRTDRPHQSSPAVLGSYEQAKINLEKLTGLTGEQCEYLIEKQIQRWHESIET